MSAQINARPGYENYALTEPVAPSQTIRKGDLVKYNAAKQIVVAAIGDIPLLGFATHAVTTGATVSDRDRLVVDPYTTQSLTRATLKNGATFDRASLVNVGAGFIDEGGEIRIDPAATVKQVNIVEIVERGIPTKDPNEVYFSVPTVANRVRN